MTFRIDLDTAQLFIALAEEENASRAAERLGLAPAIVNRRLRELEARFGLRLVKRDRNSLEPTVAGHALLHRARAMVYQADQLEREMQDHAMDTRRMVRICSAEAALFGLLPQVLRCFVDENPGARIDLIEALSTDVARVVRDGAADLGIFTGTASVGGLVLRTCWHDRVVAVVRPDHPLAGRDSVRFAELLGHELVTPDRRGAIGGLVARAAAEVGIAPRISVRVDGFDAVCRLVQLGFGAGLVPTLHHETLGRALGLVAVPIDEPAARRRFRVCARDPGQLPGLARRLFDALVAMEGED